MGGLRVVDLNTRKQPAHKYLTELSSKTERNCGNPIIFDVFWPWGAWFMESYWPHKSGSICLHWRFIFLNRTGCGGIHVQCGLRPHMESITFPSRANLTAATPSCIKSGEDLNKHTTTSAKRSSLNITKELQAQIRRWCIGKSWQIKSSQRTTAATNISAAPASSHYLPSAIATNDSGFPTNSVKIIVSDHRAKH